jgi:hypothetical protein
VGNSCVSDGPSDGVHHSSLLLGDPGSRRVEREQDEATATSLQRGGQRSPVGQVRLGHGRGGEVFGDPGWVADRQPDRMPGADQRACRGSAHLAGGSSDREHGDVLLGLDEADVSTKATIDETVHGQSPRLYV